MKIKEAFKDIKENYKNLNIVNYILDFFGLLITICVFLNVIYLHYTPALFFMLLIVALFVTPSFIYPLMIKPTLLKNNKHKKIHDKINTALFILSIIALIFVVAFIIFNLNSSKIILPDKDEDVTVIVLGAGIRNGVPLSSLKRRLDAAGEYLKENPGIKCIVAGGLNKQENLVEADVMKDYLIDNYGIDEARIFKEGHSTDTHENMKYSYEIAKENNLSKNILIITNDFHMYRSTIFAKYASFNDVYTLPVKTFPIFLTAYWFREMLSMVKAIIIVLFKI